jgi:hypothetical protein
LAAFVVIDCKEGIDDKCDSKKDFHDFEDVESESCIVVRWRSGRGWRSEPDDGDWRVGVLPVYVWRKGDDGRLLRENARAGVLEKEFNKKKAAVICGPESESEELGKSFNCKVGA